MTHLMALRHVKVHLRVCLQVCVCLSQHPPAGHQTQGQKHIFFKKQVSIELLCVLALVVK
jgi:hypothetical protein